MIDIVLYDLDGAYCPPNLSAPVGGSEVELYQLHEAFNRAGLKCELITKRPKPGAIIDCRRLIYWRQYEPAPWCHREFAPVIRATDAKPDGHDEIWTTVCVSRWQARAFKSPTIVIPPMLGSHVQRSGRRLDVLNSWLYASAANKGLRETIAAWRATEHKSNEEFYVTTTGYDDPDPESLAWLGSRWLGRVNPIQMVNVMRMMRGMYYRNAAPETFGVTTAIAVKLGLELDIECVGHEACGLAESRVPQDLSEQTTVKRWAEALGL